MVGERGWRDGGEEVELWDRWGAVMGWKDRGDEEE